MTVTYTNRLGKTTYLYRGQSKSGKTSYYFSLESGGNLATAVPKGFEIYEHPNAQVYCRRIPRQVITADERATIERGVKEYTDLPYYIVDVRKKAIIVYTPNVNFEGLDDTLYTAIHGFSLQQRGKPPNWVNFDPVMKFVLYNKRTLAFVARRFCYLGSIDDWIDISHPTNLDNLARNYLPHLEKESYFHLYLY